jgi:hypothetical protein
MEKPPPVPVEEQSFILRALCSALAFETLAPVMQEEEKTDEVTVQAHSLIKGRVSPNLGTVDIEETFYDAVEFHDGDPHNELHLAISRSSSVEMIRGGADTYDAPATLRFDPPLPPVQTPLRFIRAGKNDPIVGRQRYEETLAWRKENGMNTILKEPHSHFELIKEHYPHYYHLKGKNGMYCYYEKPPKTNLKALKNAGLQISDLLRHYAFVTEFGWQVIDRNDLGRSIYIIDLNGIGITDFVGECVDFVKQTAKFTGQHYPERAGFIYVINVPSWFKRTFMCIVLYLYDTSKCHSCVVYFYSYLECRQATSRRGYAQESIHSEGQEGNFQCPERKYRRFKHSS